MLNKYIYLRGMFSIVLAIVVYVLVLGVFVLDLFSDPSDDSWVEFICFAGIPPFMAFLIGLIVMKKRYRIIIAGILLYLLFASNLALNLLYITLSMTQFWEFAGGLVWMSISALSAIIAILICVNVSSSGKEERQLAKDAMGKEESSEGKKRMSKPSLFLLILSLLSVPTTYAVMILSAFITLGLSMFLLLIVSELPMIPVIILLAVCIAPLIGFGVAIRALWSMFITKPHFQPAVKINIQNCPNLKRIIYDVASKVKTKKPDAVILHAEPTFFVLQGKMVTFDGIVRGRVLAIGLPLLKELGTLEFQSILAHEFAHFSGRDTMYSAYVVPVYRAISSSLYDMEGVSKESSSILMKLVNLLLLTPRLFLGVFANYFATIDSMLSRSRELRADWISATIYGSQNFSSALTKVVQIGSHFGEHFEDIALDGDVDFFEEYSRVLHSSSSKLEEYLNKAFVETEQDFDTHPTISTRIKSLPANEVVEGDESLMGSAKEELLGDEKRLSTEYLGYIKTIKEMHDNRGGGDLPIHENWLAITQDIATGMEEVRKDWFTTCVKILQDRPPEEDAILTKSEVTNVHLGGEAELAAKAYQLRLASDYLALHECIPPHEGQDFADMLYSQVCGKQFKKCLPYLSRYNEVWSDSGGKRYFRFFIDVAKYITDCEAPAPEAMDIAKTHLTFAFANHIVVASAFGDVKTVKELQEKMKSESSGSLGNGGKRIMGDTVKEWVKKGDTLVTSGMYEEAIECCDKALEIDPGVGPAWYNKGVALTRLERCEEAIECFDSALEIDPMVAVTWYHKMGALANLKRYEEAQMCIDRARELDPDLEMGEKSQCPQKRS